ncbi:motility associated factor glycosyltransferase family protein [Paenibacillus polymyxa]|nr:motility associated factor glycosyltransferase family protein [Paenibacillus polymyxa]UOD86233.1 DUF115 domain-containing protein [Paenibacillus polymyxa ATCC 842]MBG9763707.1 hypothetical protein [Paenibacillus polymyxa]MCC3259790.1 DUF115 domain-containing protein [Paenibacillus polymyxa]QPK53171.1 motility associated factor glycosyltransferase family protein [Paenibacillus polymyxa]
MNGGMVLTILSLNLTAIQNRFPNVTSSMLSLEPTRAQVHKTYNEPIEKDHIWLEAVQQSVGNIECVFVYGFGQGLGIADILEMYPDRLLFVYEPDEYQFLNSISSYDMRSILEHPNLYWLAIGDSQLNSLFYMASVHMQRELAFVALRHYLEAEMDGLRDVKERLEEYNHTYESNQRTHHLFRQDWIRNSMYQMAGMLSSPSIDDLKFSFPGSTAFIIASGPSLQQDIEWVKRVQPHALVIAAGSSIQALVKQGIQPHLAVTLDGGIINDKVFSQPETLEAPLLYGSTSYFGITDRKQKDTVHFVLSNDSISQYYLGIDRAQIAITATPTVVGSAIQAAVWLGARRVVLMGQDLSFPGNKFYADGVGHIEASHNASIVEKAPRQVLNVHGEYNATNESFLFMKDALENLFAALSNIEFINTTRNGAALEGTVWKPIEEVYDMIAEEHIEHDAIANIQRNQPFTINENRIKEVKGKIENTLNDFTRFREELEVMLKSIQNIREWSRTKPLKCHNAIVEIEQRWTSIVSRDWFVPIIETVLPLEIGLFDQQQPLIAIEQNLLRKADMIHEHLGKLANEIVGKISMLEELFVESIRRIDDIKS